MKEIDINIDKEKTPLLVFYRNGDDSSIGLEFHSDTRSVAAKQQLVGAIEVFLQLMKEDMMNSIVESRDERDRSFT